MASENNNIDQILYSQLVASLINKNTVEEGINEEREQEEGEEGQELETVEQQNPISFEREIFLEHVCYFCLLLFSILLLFVLQLHVKCINVC